MKKIVLVAFVLLFIVPAWSQFTVSGKIMDKDNVLLEFASVFLEGTEHAAVSELGVRS